MAFSKMVFSSVIFLFLFLPLVLTSYFLIRKDLRNLLLLLVSLLFYYWGEGQYVLIMILYMVANYFFGLRIERCKNEQGKRSAIKAKAVFIASLFFNLGFLIYYKYFGFLVSSLNLALGAVNHPLNVPDIHLPIGISFFTFQALSYVIDVYRGDIKAQGSLIDFSMYKALFPQLIAGPIVRYRDVAGQIKNRFVDVEKMSTGIRRFVIGLGKKVLIANSLAIPADQIFSQPPEHLSCSIAWLGVVCYALQIYFDFSGYSDMAIGLGKMFGFDFLENFDYPYIAKSIKEFWRRWHISLSTWFRDYLYIPLGGNRVGVLRNYVNLLLVFSLCGLWHGAKWTFVIWGLWHGAFLVFERTRLGSLVNKLPNPVNHAYSLLVVSIGWVLFRADTFACALHFLQAMFWGAGGSSLAVGDFVDARVAAALAIGLAASTPMFANASNRLQEQIGELVRRKRILALPIAYESLRFCLLSIILLISIMSLSSGTYNPFIYFRF
jgi:alginate O-acetyltransferase complex protein AlgI